MLFPGLMSPRQTRSKMIYDSVLLAARELYAEIGFDGSTTNKIAERAGVGIGSLYRYFPDKNSILKMLTQKFIETNNEIFVSNMKKQLHLPMPVAIENIINISIDHFLAQKSFFILFLVRVYEVGLEGQIYQCRQKLAQDFSTILIDNYSHEIQLSQSELQESLYLGFHSYMATLLAYMQMPQDQQNVIVLKQNLIAQFMGIIKRSKVQQKAFNA